MTLLPGSVLRLSATVAKSHHSSCPSPPTQGLGSYDDSFLISSFLPSNRSFLPTKHKTKGPFLTPNHYLAIHYFSTLIDGGCQNIPSPNMPFWHKGYFEATKKK